MAEESEASAAGSLSGAWVPPPPRSFLFLLLRSPLVFPPFRSLKVPKLSCGCALMPGEQIQRLETEKNELISKLKKAVGVAKAMKQQMEAKDEELQVAQSRVAAFQVELQAQQDAQDQGATTIRQLNDELQQAATRFAQEEARVMVFQEEKNRLTNQVAAMLEHKQQQERETQELVTENHLVQTKVDDLMQQVTGARQQQEDTEQMYLEVASKLNQVLRENDVLQKSLEKATHDADGATGVETQIATLQAEWKDELEANAEKWELEKQQLKQQIESLKFSTDKANAELADVAEIREQLLIHVGIDLTYESIEALLDTKNKEIQMLTEQLATAEGPQEQAIREAVSAAVTEAENLRTQLDSLQAQYDSLTTEKLEQEQTVVELRAELERVAEEHSSALSAEADKHQRACESLEKKQAETEALITQLEDAHTQKQQLLDDFSAIKNKLEAFAAALRLTKPIPTEVDGDVSRSSRLAELEFYLDHIQEQLAGVAKPEMEHRQSEADILQERIHRYEAENQQLVSRLEDCEIALKERASEIEKLAVRGLDDCSDTNKYTSSGEDAASVSSNGETAESCNGDSNLERELEATKAQLHAVEAEMAACKAENLRMIFEVAKTADGVSKLKQDHETLLETHREQTSELDAIFAQLGPLKSDNQTLESNLKSTSEDLRCQLEAFAMQKEDFHSVIADLNSIVVKAEKENCKIKRDLDDIKTENDVLEERISELNAVVDSKTEPDEWQEKDREVEELRSSLVQAKVNFLDQKQQLTALEKKLVEVSRSSGPACAVNSASLDAERREFEAALIEMIEMEQKLQVAYEAKQGLESTLQERMQAKAELEDRLSIADDKIAELEQQLEQKVALIATIEEQLRSVEEEREKLADEFAKTKSKLERSRGKLEEKTIEFEAFKTTTNMLKDERSRLFNEIAMLKDKIAKSEVQKAAMADSQELANEELEEQLNELADRIAEIETEKQDLRARLEETVYRSEEDIHQLRERLYMLEEEKSGLDDENLKLEAVSRG
uniref:GRIP domain-containing protein n=1 Tax=Phytophthora ramorum TaxID=164328 RepID=H3GEM2_PHYRM